MPRYQVLVKRVTIFTVLVDQPNHDPDSASYTAEELVALQPDQYQSHTPECTAIECKEVPEPSTCDHCGADCDTVVGCPDGREVCRHCFDQGVG